MPQAPTSLTVAHERRGARRMPTRRDLDLLVLGADERPIHRIHVRALDVSHSGLGVVAQTQLRPGLRAVAPLERRDGRRALVGVEVMHAHSGSDGHDATGCAAGLRFFKLPPAIVKHVRL